MPASLPVGSAGLPVGSAYSPAGLYAGSAVPAGLSAGSADSDINAFDINSLDVRY